MINFAAVLGNKPLRSLSLLRGAYEQAPQGLWRAVDHDREILESFITKTRDKGAALTFKKKALKRHGLPDAITTDGLRSYRAAMKGWATRRRRR